MPKFHQDRCPGCAALMPAGLLCCDACMRAVPQALRQPYFAAIRRVDRRAKATHAAAILAHLEAAKTTPA